MPFSKEPVIKKAFLKKANQVKPSHVCVWLIFYTVGLNINWSRIKRVTSLELANMWPFWTPAELKFGNMVLDHLSPNAPNWSPYISFKIQLGEFDSRSKHFLLRDHFINSHHLISWQGMNIVGRKLMLVTFGTWRVKKGARPIGQCAKIRFLSVFKSNCAWLLVKRKREVSSPPALETQINKQLGNGI